MKTFRKSDIETHSDRGPSHPAVNVKCYKTPSLYRTMEHFKCCEATAQQALDYAFQSAQECFWEGIQELADHYLGSHVKTYGEGRSSGWVVVHNLPDIDSWDAIAVSRWGNFARAVRRDVDWRCSEEAVWENIECNEWAPADALLDDVQAEEEEKQNAACRDIATI